MYVQTCPWFDAYCCTPDNMAHARNGRRRSIGETSARTSLITSILNNHISNFSKHFYSFFCLEHSFCQALHFSSGAPFALGDHSKLLFLRRKQWTLVRSKKFVLNYFFRVKCSKSQKWKCAVTAVRRPVNVYCVLFIFLSFYSLLLVFPNCCSPLYIFISSLFQTKLAK